MERVFELFERHSIDRPTMAEILGVSLSTLKGHGLVDHIDNKKLDELAETFAVARGWLLGNYDSPAICVCRWHVREDPVHRLLRFAIAGKEPRIHFVKSKRFTTEEVIREEARISFTQIEPTSKIAIVTEVKHQTSSGRSYNSYERWESVPWDRELDRKPLLTLVMFCERIPNTPRGFPDLNGSAKEIESRLKYKIRLYDYKFHSDSVEIDNEVLMEYERGVVTPRELVSHHSRSGWFSIDDHIDLPEWSAVGKADPGEYKEMLERYERMLVNLSWDREFKELLSSD